MSAEEVAEKSNMIARATVALPEFERAGQIFAYLAAKNEVHTRPIIEIALGQGKAVYAPRMVGNQLFWGQFTSETELASGRFGILEPTADAPAPTAVVPNDLCLVPGVLFGTDGHRIGQGGGHYDRFLRDYAGTSLGLAFDWQLDKAFASESHDVPLQFIQTERRLVVPRSARGQAESDRARLDL